VEAPGFSASLALDRDPDKNPLTALRCFRNQLQAERFHFLERPNCHTDCRGFRLPAPVLH
jgi:hypothetical protein